MLKVGSLRLANIVALRYLAFGVNVFFSEPKYLFRTFESDLRS